MTPERLLKIKELFDAASKFEAAERSAFLENACRDDEDLKREVQLLLDQDCGTGILDRPAWDGFGEAGLMQLASGMRFGPYEILEEIAVGGMGAVYRAVRADGQYRQQVALKVVRAELGAELTASRFRNERQILASLDHPNIARILDGATTGEGLPYFVMELIDGLPITEYCDKHRLSVEARVSLFRMVCSAVHYAHQHLVIHRDIKPS